MHFAVRIQSPNGFSAGGVALASRLVQPGPSGVIAVVAGPDPVGAIEPDISRAAGGSGRELLLQSIFLNVAGGPTGGANDRITIVDETGAEAYEIASLSGVTAPFYSDRRWVVPVGYRVLVNFAPPGAATLQMNFWVLESADQLSAAAPVTGA